MKALLKRLCAAALCLSFMVSSLSAYAAGDFVTGERYEAGEVVLELEAEDFEGEGFSVAEDPTASGGKCIVGSGDETKKMCHTITVDKACYSFVVYGVHKSSSKDEALSYISVNNFENYSLYDYKYNQWNSTRIYFNELDPGDYTINLRSVRAGQMIDKIIIKYNVREDEEGAGDAANNLNYVAGHPEYESLPGEGFREQKPGTIKMEFEDGIFEKENGLVAEDENASGGKYWRAASTQGAAKATDIAEPELRMKFYISKKGSYRMFLRYYIDTPNRSMWMGIDNDNYSKTGINASPLNEWSWRGPNTYHFDEGWHTLDFKRRSGGVLRMDSVIITTDPAYIPLGYGALPGDEIKLDPESAKKIYEQKHEPKVRGRNFRLRGDCEFEFVDNDIMLSGANLAMALGIQLEIYKDCYVIRRGRQYVKYYPGSRRSIVNGVPYLSDAKTENLDEEDDIPRVSLLAAQKAFGLDFQYDGSSNTVNIYDFFEEEEIRVAGEDEIKLYVSEDFIHYEIPCDNPNAQVEVWLRSRISDADVVQRTNVDNLNTIKQGGYLYKHPQYQYLNDPPYWQKAQTPVYKDGAFRGAMRSYHELIFEAKVRIVENNRERVFKGICDKRTIHQNGSKTPEEYKYNTEDGLIAVPTFENVSFYLDADGENPTCKAYYRKKGDEEWKAAYEPMWDFQTKQFRGTLTFLEQDTEYELRAAAYENGRKLAEGSTTVRTWQDNPPIKEIIKLKDIYGGSGDLMLYGICGSDDGWVKIDGEGMTVDAGKLTYDAVVISKCQNLIFENVRVRGGIDACIAIDSASKNIRIANCDIAEWGLGSVFDNKSGLYMRSGTTFNYSAGIIACASENLVIERCYIHDSDTKTNPWIGTGYMDVHPAGSCGVYMMGKRGTVIRYNDFVGSDEHRFNDVLEGAGNGGRGDTSTGSDSDIYGNMLIFSNDDIMELDSGQMNVRVYHNRMEQAHVGISGAPNTMGPSYIYRNVIDNLGGVTGDDFNYYGLALKIGGAKIPFSMTYFFNNTVFGNNIIQNSNHGGSTVHHDHTRNNMFITNTGKGTALQNRTAQAGRDSYDYDVLWGTVNLSIEGQEQNAIFERPEFLSEEKAEWHLADGSPGKGSGLALANFTADGKVNRGAFVGDENDPLFMPARPVDMSADTYRVLMQNKETREIKIRFGNIGEGRSFSLVKNRDFDWLEFADDETENIKIEPNSEVTVRITADTSKLGFNYPSQRKFSKGKGLFLVRLDNGFSIPITVFCEK